MKRNIKKKILLLSPVFSPNIGGVETHLDDLAYGLSMKDYEVYVETFSPITTKSIEWKKRERLYGAVNIRRHWWFGNNVFHFVEKYPLLDFLYLSPYLFVICFLFLLKHKDVKVIHAHGMNAALVAVLVSVFFRTKTVVSTHAVYERNKKSLTALFVAFILKRVSAILTLSMASKNEIVSFGIPERKVHVYRYWLDLELFKPRDRICASRMTGRSSEEFTVLFVGRLIEKKGVRLFAEIARKLHQIRFVIIGVGPMEAYVRERESELANLSYLGKKSNNEVVNYMNRADLLCIPSQYEEGYGRVVMEAVACGIPVVGSNMGAIPEAVDSSVALLSKPTIDEIGSAISSLYEDPETYYRYRKNCREYALRKFSPKNIQDIIKYY